MDDFVVHAGAEFLPDLVGPQAANAARFGCSIVGQPARKLLPGRVADAHDISLLELSHDLEYPDRKQTVGAGLQRPAGAIVDHEVAAWPRGQADPALPCAVG